VTDPHIEIDALHAAWARAVSEGDVDAIVEMLAPDYELWAPGAEPVRGREAVRAMMAGALGQYEISSAFRSEECLVCGDLAIDRGWDEQTVRPRDGGPSQSRRQRVFLVLRRGDDGQWRYARGISQAGPDPKTD
jgi:uncharacterized protein (TIGR02246 family)